MSDQNALEAAKKYVAMEHEIRELEIEHEKGNSKKWSELVGRQAQLGVRYAIDWAMETVKRNGN